MKKIKSYPKYYCNIYEVLPTYLGLLNMMYCVDTDKKEIVAGYIYDDKLKQYFKLRVNKYNSCTVDFNGDMLLSGDGAVDEFKKSFILSNKYTNSNRRLADLCLDILRFIQHSKY